MGPEAPFVLGLALEALVEGVLLIALFREALQDWALVEGLWTVLGLDRMRWWKPRCHLWERRG